MVGLNDKPDAALTMSLLDLQGNPLQPRRPDAPPPAPTEPKVGVVDPLNEPHVGGNTFMGGTGGANTAGLGGAGGPFRFDSGNPVTQVRPHALLHLIPSLFPGISIRTSIITPLLINLNSLPNHLISGMLKIIAIDFPSAEGSSLSRGPEGSA